MKKGFNGTLNRLLAALAVIMLALWAKRFISQGGLSTLGRGGGLSTLMWLAVAVVCCGYLLWRFMGWLFWHKYFKDEDPPDDDGTR